MGRGPSLARQTEASAGAAGALAGVLPEGRQEGERAGEWGSGHRKESKPGLLSEPQGGWRGTSRNEGDVEEDRISRESLRSAHKSTGHAHGGGWEPRGPHGLGRDHTVQKGRGRLRRPLYRRVTIPINTLMSRFDP